MKFVLVPMVLLGLAAGAFGLISLTGEKHMIIERIDSPTAGAKPAIDSQEPGTIETATFALG